MVQECKNKIITEREQVRDYILKYLDELKVHFNLSDKQMRDILKQAHFEIRVKNPVKNFINVLKSFLPSKGR